tara:strand:+ start:3550 stop:4470 length:921 start_codon:yes stop_codon:yes gene_type:complete
VGLSESEVRNLRSLDNTFAFEYQRKANDTWKFNYKMLKYDKSWETYFPICLCKEMVEEILSWCSIYDLRFLFPRLAIGLRLRLFRLPREDSKIISPVKNNMSYKKQKVMENALDIADIQYQSTCFSLREMVRLGQFKEVLFKKWDLVAKFYSSLTRIWEDKDTTTYEEVVENILEEDGRGWFILREAFIKPLFAELTDLYKKPLGMDYDNFYNGYLLLENNHSHSASWKVEHSLNMYKSPLLVLMSLDTKDRTQRDYNMEALETYFTENRIRYYCRGVLKGEGWDKFPKTWSAKKYITYLMKYQGI